MDTVQTFNIEKQALWRQTFDDGVLTFKNVVLQTKEKAQEELKAENKNSKEFEHFEENWVKILKSDSNACIVQSKLYYYPKLNAIFSVIEVRTNDENQPIFVRMVKHQDSGEVILEDTEEIKTLRDYIKVDVRVYYRKFKLRIFK